MSGNIPVPSVPGMDLGIEDDGYELRYHPDAAIDGALRQALNDLDGMSPDKRFATIAHVDEGGGQLVAMARIAKGWSFAGILDSDWKGNLSYGAEVRFSV